MIRRVLLAGIGGFLAFSATARSRRVEFPACGVSFTVPASWSAQLLPSKEVDDSMRCGIALRPRGWSQRAKRSRWSAPDPPLDLVIFKSDTSYDEALDQMGFETDEDHDGRFGVPGGYGSFATATPYRAGKSTGQAAFTFFRGFINDETLLKKDESRVFSGDDAHIVLTTPSGQVFAFECAGGTPDEPVNCEAVIQMIGRSIIIRTPR